jgi:hypothetical protein
MKALTAREWTAWEALKRRKLKNRMARVRRLAKREGYTLRTDRKSLYIDGCQLVDPVAHLVVTGRLAGLETWLRGDDPHEANSRQQLQRLRLPWPRTIEEVKERHRSH